MFRHGNGETIELAMTHRVGATGETERCLRPHAVREVAERMHRWAIAAEGCQSCHGLPAVRIVSGMALCGRCHAHRAERLARGPWTRADLRPRAARADDPPPANPKALHGYAIRFNEPSVELWGFIEVVRPQAVDRTISETPDLRALWNHDSAEPIGRVSAGTLAIAKRTRGLWTEIDPPRWADRYVESVERRDVTGMSFAFMTLEDDWWIEDGMPHREILDMEIIEVSPVSFPAYPTTTIKAVDAGDRSDRVIEQQTAERLRLAQ